MSTIQFAALINSDAVVSKHNTCTMNVVVQAPVVQILDSTDPLDKPPSSGWVF